MKWVICCYEDSHCGKSPCMALVDDSINIDKFKECFYSTVNVEWRLATRAESIHRRVVREKEKQNAAQTV